MCSTDLTCTSMLDHQCLAPDRPGPRLVTPLHGGGDAGGEDAVVGQRDVRRHQPQHLWYPAGTGCQHFCVKSWLSLAATITDPAAIANAGSWADHSQLPVWSACMRTMTLSAGGASARAGGKEAQRTARTAGPWCTRRAGWRCARGALPRPPAASGGTACTSARRLPIKHSIRQSLQSSPSCRNSLANDAGGIPSMWPSGGLRTSQGGACASSSHRVHHAVPDVKALSPRH